MVDVSCQQFILTVFLLSIDFSTMCQINWLPAQKAVKWMPRHFEFSSVIFLCQPLVTSWRKLLSASCLSEQGKAYQHFSLSMCVCWKANELADIVGLTDTWEELLIKK